jgi:hypothetical protein
MGEFRSVIGEAIEIGAGTGMAPAQDADFGKFMVKGLPEKCLRIPARASPVSVFKVHAKSVRILKRNDFPKKYRRAGE